MFLKENQNVNQNCVSYCPELNFLFKIKFFKVKIEQNSLDGVVRRPNKYLEFSYYNYLSVDGVLCNIFSPNLNNSSPDGVVRRPTR